MADDPAKEPLISGLLDPPTQAQKRTNIKKRRFRRCKSAPPVDVLAIPEKPEAFFPGSNIIFTDLRPSFTQIILLVGLYLVVGSTCFYLVRDHIDGKKTNGFLDALYFVIVTMTTVGYGDLVPKSTGAKLLACGFVFSGMTIIALFLSKAADYFVEKQEMLLVRAFQLQRKGGEAQMLREMVTKRAMYKLLTTTVILVVLMAGGTIFLMKVEKLEFVDACYCVCSTITTLGYGDKSFSTEGGRVFAVAWILASTVCLAQFFLYLAEVFSERRQQQLVKWVLTRRMTFVDLEAADLDDDGVVSSAEFILYKLKEMGKINQEDISLVMEEFEDLDVDQSGAISASDLVIAQS